MSIDRDLAIEVQAHRDADALPSGRHGRLPCGVLSRGDIATHAARRGGRGAGAAARRGGARGGRRLGQRVFDDAPERGGQVGRRGADMRH